MNMYQIEQSIRDFLDSLIGGELSEDQLDQLDKIYKDSEDLVESCAKVYQERHAAGEALRKEGNVLIAAARRHEAACENLKEMLKHHLNRLGVPRVVTTIFQVGLQTSPPRVVVDESLDLDKLPPDLVRVKKDPNKEALLNMAKIGESLPEGVRIVQEVHVRISPR
jgi:hypothetical protein